MLCYRNPDVQMEYLRLPLKSAERRVLETYWLNLPHGTHWLRFPEGCDSRLGERYHFKLVSEPHRVVLVRLRRTRIGRSWYSGLSNCWFNVRDTFWKAIFSLLRLLMRWLDTSP
jgi:hypothetical protein